VSAPLSVGIVCFPSLGGSGIVAAELAVGLSLRGHRVHIITSAPPSRTLPPLERLFLHEVSAPGHPAIQDAPYALALAAKLVEIAEGHGLDIVHVHYALPHAASAYLARQVLGRAAPRIVTTLHGTDVTRIGSDPSYRSITRFTVTRSDGVTVPSEFLKSEAYRRLGVPADVPIEVIPNFVDVDHFTPAERRARAHFDALFDAAGGDPADRGAPVLFHVSSFRPVKRVTDLVETLARVRRRARARLMLVGDGPDREPLMARARELDVARSVRLVGTHAEFVDDLRHADAFLLSSETESFGVAALEAMSCGVPVCAYRVGGLPEVVTPDVGRLVEPRNVDALAAAALEIVSDEARRDALGRAARARAAAFFHRDHAIDRYEDHYRRAIAAAAREAV
jgi:N-acetyl-alpha-D-glucosaminyl L-malate synthase BshA